MPLSSSEVLRMIEGRLIVCIASSWDYDPTSKHQIMSILSRRNEIVWINYHGTRRPQANAADVWAAKSAIGRFLGGARRVTPSIVQVTPLVIPGAFPAILRRLHQRMLIGQIRRAVRAVDPDGRKPVQLWSFAPDVPYLCGRLNEECSVYYCVDEYSEFEGFDSQKIKTTEEEFMARADLVVTTSQQLYETKRLHIPDTLLVRHGVDFDHFAAAWRSSLPRPDDLAGVPGPIFGFFGLIHHWIDSALLAQVARLRPHYSFVVIGDCRVDVSELARLDNVYLLGRRPYAELPAYCATFDAGLLPFARSAMTRNINPIKMYEYLAAGLPVVSTSLPEARRFEGPITIADTAEDFAEACDGVLAADHSGRREAISATVKDDTWTSRVDLLSEAIMGVVDRKSGKRGVLGEAASVDDNGPGDLVPALSGG